MGVEVSHILGLFTSPIEAATARSQNCDSQNIQNKMFIDFRNVCITNITRKSQGRSLLRSLYWGPLFVERSLVTDSWRSSAPFRWYAASHRWVFTAGHSRWRTGANSRVNMDKEPVMALVKPVIISSNKIPFIEGISPFNSNQLYLINGHNCREPIQALKHVCFGHTPASPPGVTS